MFTRKQTELEMYEEILRIQMKLSSLEHVIDSITSKAVFIETILCSRCQRAASEPSEEESSSSSSSSTK